MLFAFIFGYVFKNGHSLHQIWGTQWRTPLLKLIFTRFFRGLEGGGSQFIHRKFLITNFWVALTKLNFTTPVLANESSLIRDRSLLMWEGVPDSWGYRIFLPEFREYRFFPGDFSARRYRDAPFL